MGMTVLERCDIERVDVVQQLVKTGVGARSMFPGELFGLCFPPRPNPGEAYVLYKTQTFCEPAGYAARTYISHRIGLNACNPTPSRCLNSSAFITISAVAPECADQNRQCPLYLE